VSEGGGYGEIFRQNLEQMGQTSCRRVVDVSSRRSHGGPANGAGPFAPVSTPSGRHSVDEYQSLVCLQKRLRGGARFRGQINLFRLRGATRNSGHRLRGAGTRRSVRSLADRADLFWRGSRMRRRLHAAVVPGVRFGRGEGGIDQPSRADRPRNGATGRRGRRRDDDAADGGRRAVIRAVAETGDSLWTHADGARFY